MAIGREAMVAIHALLAHVDTSSRGLAGPLPRVGVGLW